MKLLKSTFIFVLLCFSSVFVMAQVEDLIHHYKFDGDLTDAVGGEDGVVSSPVGVTEPTFMEGFDGTPDGAILFSGDILNFYMVNVGTWSPSQEGAPDEMTVAFWAYWNGSTGSWQDIINKRDNWSETEMVWGINQHDATGSVISVRKNGMNADSNDSIPYQVWTHVAVAMDNENAYFFKDGILYDTQPYVYATGFGAMIHLGTSANTGGEARVDDLYNGALDDVRFYSRVLEENEVFEIYEGISGLDDKSSTVPALIQNYPNPFNSSTTIRYSLTRNTQTEIVVYDLLGHKVTTLVDEYRNAGTHKVIWDASGLSTGVYIYQLRTDDFIVSKKMKLIR